MSRQVFSRRQFLGAAAVSGSAIIAAACGQAESPPKPVEKAADKPAAPVAAQPASKPAAGGTLNGVFWFNQPAQQEAFQKIMERFHQSQSKVKLETVLVPAAEIAAKLATAIAGGTPPDACRMGGPGLNALFINNKHAAALDDFDPKIGTYDWLPNAKAVVTRDGKMYAMPVNSGVQALIYNRDLYEKAGLDPARPPKTFDEVLEHSAKIAGSGDGRFGYYNDTAPNSITGGDQFLAILWSFGGREVSEDGKQVTLNTPEGVAALGFYKALVDKKGLPQKALTGPQVLNDFLTGNVGGMFSYPGNLARAAQAGFKTVASQLPAGPKGSQSQMGGGTIIVFEKAKNKEAGWEFAKFIGLDAANNAAWNIGFGQLPPRESFRADPTWKDFEAKTPLVPPYMEAQKTARLPYYGPGSQEIFTEFGKAIEAVVFGQKTPAQAAEETHKAAQVVLDRELKKG
ncbi:MAG: ABC transporter substrate-binding protein [Chloroflexota bacterium]